FSVALLLALAGLSNAYLDEGECPPFQTTAEFEIPLYLGRWFEAERYPTAFETDQSCVTADYGAIDDTTISVTNTAILPDGTVTSISGTATATDVPGQLILQFPNEAVGFYNVLGTDYENYSTVYACSQVGTYRTQYAWILSRREVLEEEYLTMAMDVFTANGIDTSVFMPTPQGGDCMYVDPPEPV
ncbi:Lipocalin/cytosolic fatty-acid binding domain, partial [Trinorchestia longiramus]